MNFNTIETCCNGIACRRFVIVHNAWNLIDRKSTRLRRGHKTWHAIDQLDCFCFCNERRRCDRRLTARLKTMMRDAAHMPKLHDNFSALRVNRCSDGLPCVDLRRRPDARHIHIPLALVADGCCLGDDEARARCRVGALRIVFSHEGIGQCMRCSVASQWCHHNA